MFSLQHHIQREMRNNSLSSNFSLNFITLICQKKEKIYFSTSMSKELKHLLCTRVIFFSINFIILKLSLQVFRNRRFFVRLLLHGESESIMFPMFRDFNFIFMTEDAYLKNEHKNYCLKQTHNNNKKTLFVLKKLFRG